MGLFEKLQHIRLEVGTIQNDFDMTRGSFRYRQKAGQMEELRFVGSSAVFEEGNPKGAQKYLLDYVDRKGRCHRLKAARDAGDGLIRIIYSGVQNGDVWEPDADLNRYRIHIACNPNEHFYGCGETYSVFDLRGERVRIWVAEHQNADRIAKKLVRETISGKNPERVLPFDQYESYYAQPTFTSSGKYFVHVNTSRFAVFDFTHTVSRNSEMILDLQDVPDIVIGSGRSFEEVSELLTGLLRSVEVPAAADTEAVKSVAAAGAELPDWIYNGVILGIQQGPAVIERKLDMALSAGAKVCGVWSQDWCGCRRTGFGYQVMWNWTYDRNLYPDLPDKIRTWNKEGIRFLGYINPFMAIEKELYKEASQKGYCVKDRKGKDYLVTITTFPAAMIDLTNPAAYAWYKEIIKTNMIGIGLSGWMADFGEYLPVDCVLYDGSDPYLMHNQWPAIWAKLNREAIRESGKEGEVFFFTRAGHTGTVRYSDMMWTGDQHVDWSVDDGIGSVIPATLSLAMSGFGIAHSDVGGYTTMKQMKRSKELLMRWEEMNVFSPLWRSHEGNQPVNDVQFADDAELLLHLTRCSNMHAALKPYLKELEREMINRGIPVMRPLFYYYEEPEAFVMKTEYLLGRDLLVAPVLKEGVKTRDVWLPDDSWIHLWTGQMYGGGYYRISAPVGEPPVFVRRGSRQSGMLLSLRNYLW